MKVRILLFTFLLFTFYAKAQDFGGVSGVVTDSKSGTPIENVEVLVNPGNKGTTTNAEGKFEVMGLKPGDYTILINSMGYIQIEKSFAVKPRVVDNMTFALDIDVKELLAVEIVDDKIENHAYSKVVLKDNAIQEFPVRDIGDFLREVPNISAVRKGGANLDPVIRGFKFDQLNIQLDNGLRMEGGCPNRMDPTTSHVESGDIEAIEVVKGPFALRYGPVMGGVVNLITLNPRPFDNFQVHVKANMG
jgi:iron complex outermembrane receptor protein